MLPPPARKTAEGAPPFSSETCFPMASARRVMGSSIARCNSSRRMLFTSPKISVYCIASSWPSCRFSVSAVWKSTRYARMIASVTSSPAIVAMV